MAGRPACWRAGVCASRSYRPALPPLAGMFGTRLPELVNLSSFTIVGSRLDPESADGPETAIVRVEVQHAQQAAAGFEFHLRRKRVGPRKGAWTTWMLLREGQQR